jgi:hypothetical protein
VLAAVADACPTSPSCCWVAVDSGPRAGISINGDQWLLGAHLRVGLPCFGGLGLSHTLAFGLGGNYFTLRSSGRLDYMFWFDNQHIFGIYPTAGVSALFYGPVGGFASFCSRVGLDECWGHDAGWEAGGGIRYRWLGVDALVGFAGLPVLTVMVGAWFPLTHPGDE